MEYFLSLCTYIKRNPNINLERQEEISFIEVDDKNDHWNLLSWESIQQNFHNTESHKKCAPIAFLYKMI